MNTGDNLFNKTAIEYDLWFDEHENAWRSELLALESFIPQGKEGLEVGVGTGRFAAEFGIKTGIEPAHNMAEMARTRGIKVIEGVGENLPYADNRFDFVLLVAVDCFVDDIEKTYSEAFRVLKHGGRIIIGLLDKNGTVAQKYQAKKAPDNVYWYSHFHTTEETVSLLEKVGFKNFEFYQTLTVPDPPMAEEPLPGYGQGSFVAIKAEKQLEV